jgi:hypothetical protein
MANRTLGRKKARPQHGVGCKFKLRPTAVETGRGGARADGEA